ncbi:MAG: cytochrome c biogenesis protein CcdA [Patescibacteria group bacterium]
MYTFKRIQRWVIFFALCVVFAVARPIQAQESTVDATSAAVSTTPLPKTNIVYFYSDTCSHCRAIKPLLKDIEKKYGDSVEFRRYEVRISQRARVLFSKFLSTYGVPTEQGGTPTIAIGDTILIGEDEVKGRLESIINYCGENTCLLKGGLDADVGGQKPREAERSTVDGVAQGKISLPLILSAALVDSINPCAIGVLLLLIGFLLSVHGSRKKLALLGFLYILSVYVTYLLAGLGILHVIGILNIAVFIKGIAAAILLGTAFISLKEIFAPGSTFLRIPERAKGLLTHWLTKGSVTGVLIAGFLVSAVELPCTGAVYLGILSLLSNSTDRWLGYSYLAIYNLIFVAPLLGILGLALFGVRAEAIQKTFKKHTKTMRVSGGLLMLLLGLWIVFEIVRGTA